MRSGSFSSVLLALWLQSESKAESPFSIDFSCPRQVFDVSSLSCSACDASSSLSASSDKSRCLPCDGASGAVYNGSTLQCDCVTASEYLSDSEDSIACNPCPAQHAVSLRSGDRYECALCRAPMFIDSDNEFQCRCPSGTHIATLSGGGCVSVANATYISNIYDLAESARIDYGPHQLQRLGAGPVVAASALFAHYFLDSAVHCKLRRDVTSCQIMANLCVLTMFNKEHAACQLLLEVSEGSDAVSNNFPNWKQNLPFLFYPDDGERSSSALSSALTVSLSSVLTLIAVKYSMNGTMIGHQEITSELFSFCAGGVVSDDALKFNRIGHNTVVQCSYDFSSILEEESGDGSSWNEPQFFAPYLFVPSDSTYYPVPVHVANIDNRDGLKLVRRFFVSERISSNNELVAFIRAAALKVTVFGADKIRPPLISIEYGLKRATDSNRAASLSFTAHYAMDWGSFATSIAVLFAILLILVLLLCVFQIFRFQRMEISNHWPTASNSPQLDLLWFLRILLLGFGVSANLLFWFLFFVASYCYLAFKGQSKIKFLMPEHGDSLLVAFRALLTYCFFAKLLHILMAIWDQCHVDIFLMDWERPRGNIMAMIQQQQFVYNAQSVRRQQPQYIGNGMTQQNRFVAQQQQQQHQMAYDQPPNPSAKRSPRQQIQRMAESTAAINKHVDSIGVISCWRKLFVANEWNELSIHRDITPSLTLFLLLCLMTGFEFEYLALEQPVAAASAVHGQVTPISMVYKFVISSFFVLAISAAEYVYFFFVRDRFCCSDPFIDLIDLASLGNISVFVLDRKYHGFYVHGKTVHQHSDTSLEEINKNIEDERRRLCKARGLLPEQEIFEIFVSHRFRQQYDEIYRDVLQYELTALRQQKRPSLEAMTRSMGNADAPRPSADETDNILLSKQLIASSKLLSMFLSDFIEKSCPHRWELREAMGFERATGPIPNVAMEQNCVFYHDAACRFKHQLMFVGLQYDLVILWLLTIAFVDNIVLSAHNTTVSVLVAYSLDFLLTRTRAFFGERNVSRKTMIDQRFLL